MPSQGYRHHRGRLQRFVARPATKKAANELAESESVGGIGDPVRVNCRLSRLIICATSDLGLD
jgi:hypothetical protein